MPSTLRQDGPDTALARILLASGRLSLDVLRPELEAARVGGPSLAHRLVHAGHVSPLELEALIHSNGVEDSAIVRRTDALLSGFALDRFELKQELGRGGMGVVYRARDTLLDREVAIKCLQITYDTEMVELERFKREAQTLAGLHHPGLARVHEVLPESPIGPCIVMDFVPGQNLADLVQREGPLPPRRAVELILQAADGVAHAHAHDIIHRDLKPANLMVRPDGQVVVLDFGLARQVRDESSLTTAGEVVGTPAYMAPEQILAQPLDARTDVYALGVILYYALMGAQPFQGRNSLAIFNEVLNVGPPALEGVPQPIADVVLTCLSKEPELRYRDVNALTRALTAALEPEAPPPKTGRLRLLAGLALAAAGGGVALAFALHRAPEPAPLDPTARSSPGPIASPRPIASPTPAPSDRRSALVERLAADLADGKLTAAEETARRILARTPGDVAAQRGLIESVRRQGRLVDALALADDAIARRPHPLLRLARARIHFDAGRDQAVVRDLVWLSDHFHRNGFLLRGRAQVRLKRYHVALKDLNVAIEERASFSAHLARAEARAHCGDRRGAEEDLEAARRLAGTPEERERVTALRAALSKRPAR